MMHLVLMLNLMLLTMRLAQLLRRFQAIGIMMIVMTKIIREDLPPFAALSVLLIFFFEVASYFFTWVMYVPSACCCFSSGF